MNNKIKDFISNKEIFITSEEIDSIQPISKELVENLGYPKENIITKPQFRISKSPSDNRGSYPLDIAVFKNFKKKSSNLFFIVECKKKEETRGIEQLKKYLGLCQAEFGVWDNGKNRKILRKIINKNKFDFIEIPSIPRYKENIEKIGKYYKKDLISPKDLKNKFKMIRNHLAANNVGATRDEKIAQQIIYIIFTKLYDEKHTNSNEFLKFTYDVEMSTKLVAENIKNIWKKVKEDQEDIFDKSEKIDLDDENISFIVKELQQYCFMDSDRLVISEAFETFIGNSLKGEQGQFFTPRNVIELAVKIANPKSKSMIIDPACGTGGFLIEATKYVWNKIDKEGQNKGWKKDLINNEKKNFAIKYVTGIDKDNFLSKVTKSYMMLIGDGRSGIFTANSLDYNSWTQKNMKEKIKMDKFDFVFTNPPFGSKIKIKSKKILKKYEIINFNEEKPTPPQILFIEKCFKLLKNKGKLLIILPDAIIGNSTSKFVRNYIAKYGNLLAIISLPIATFQPHTSTKTSLLVIEKNNNPKNKNIFISTPKTCGHNRRGVKIKSDEVSDVIDLYKDFLSKGGHN